MGYIIIKHFDVLGDENIEESIRDFIVLETERLEVENGEYVLHPKEFEGYENIPMPEPPVLNPDICNKKWTPPEKDSIPYGSQRITINNGKSFGYVEFYYKKVIE